MSSGLQPTSTMVPARAAALGAAGLAPFILGTAARFYTPHLLGMPVDTLVLVYAGLILSFIGGAHWGMASAALGNDAYAYDSAQVLTVSVLPSLFAWVFIFLPPKWGLPAIAVAFALVFVIDLWLTRIAYAPAWWLRLRLPLTAAVIVSLLLLTAATLLVSGARPKAGVRAHRLVMPGTRECCPGSFAREPGGLAGIAARKHRRRQAV